MNFLNAAASYPSQFLATNLPLTCKQPETSFDSNNRSSPNTNNRVSLADSTPSTTNGLASRLKPIKLGNLNSSDIESIKKLINGYRESAAFLYKTADELEQLIDTDE
jgi:hypothetical protein